MIEHRSGLTALHDEGGMTWTSRERGWLAVPEEVLSALAGDGFEECKREMTTSRRDQRPVGGVWQGVNPTTGSVASAIWVARATQCRALVFVEIDGELIKLSHDDGRRFDVSYRERRRRRLNAESDVTLRRIDVTVARLLLTHYQVPPERRAGYLEARHRLQRARVRRFRQLQ